jgi:hypothetical protein
MFADLEEKSRRTKSMSRRSYFLHQAEVCGSLARGTDDPSLRQRYEDLQIDFLRRGSREDDGGDDSEIAFSVTAKPKPDSGDASPHR